VRRAIFYLQCLLAVILLVRVLCVPLLSVRRLLVFALVPTVLAPFIMCLESFAIDYRALWLVLQVVDWVCLVGVAYSLVTGLFPKLPGVGRMFRRTFTVALTAIFLAAMIETQYLLPSSVVLLTGGAFIMNRAILTAVGLFVASILGIVFWCRVQVPKNLAVVSSGIVIQILTRGIGVVFGDTLRNAGVRFYEGASIIWITLLTYWILFLSSNDDSPGAGSLGRSSAVAAGVE